MALSHMTIETLPASFFITLLPRHLYRRPQVPPLEKRTGMLHLRGRNGLQSTTCSLLGNSIPPISSSSTTNMHLQHTITRRTTRTRRLRRTGLLLLPRAAALAVVALGRCTIPYLVRRQVGSRASSMRPVVLSVAWQTKVTSDMAVRVREKEGRMSSLSTMGSRFRCRLLSPGPLGVEAAAAARARATRESRCLDGSLFFQ